jgi:type VI secretion system protein ImpH
VTPLAALAGLAEAPHRFDFVSAMRLLECAFPDRPRIGRSVRPREDAVRLAHQVHMAFPAGSVASFTPGGGEAGTLRVFLLGLLGPNGPLPLHITEYVLDRLRRPEDKTLRSFLDLFHHRLLSLFWRAMADARPALECDRPAQDRFARHLGSCASFGSAVAAASDRRVDQARRHWVGQFSRQTRDPEGLRSLLAGFFRTSVRIDEFVGVWLPMPGRDRCRLGQPTRAVLGRDAVLGESVWDCSQTFRVVLGPLSLANYERLLPGTENWQRLRELVRTYVGVALALEVRLVLRAEDAPDTHLGACGRLGWTTWLGQTSRDRDLGDLLLQPDAAASHSPVLSN